MPASQPAQRSNAAAPEGPENDPTLARVGDTICNVLNDGEFLIEHLPIVPDQRCVGAEALIRWRRPGGEIILPGEFIALSENNPLSGLIT